MRKRGFSFEQWISFIAIAMILLLGAVFFAYYPAFSPLGDRTERTPPPSDERYLLAQSGAQTGYDNMLYSGGRHPFMPGTSLSFHRRSYSPKVVVISRSRRSYSPRSTTPPPPKTSKKPVPTPTPPPFVVPVSLVGIVKLDDSGRRVILKVNKSGQLRTLAVGEEIEGMIVVEITSVSVSLKAPNGKIYVLKDPRSLY